MKTFSYTITDEVGIHARPAGLLAKKAKEFESVCTIEKTTLNRTIYYIASMWNDATLTRRQEVRCRTADYVCDKFVQCNGFILNWDEIYFTQEEAEARLAELKEEKE